MSVSRILSRCLIVPEQVPPSRDDFEVVGAFNPGAVAVDGQVFLLVRVAERPRERRAGFLGSPRWAPDAGLVVDWLPEEEWESVDARVVRRKRDGTVRLTSVSHVRVVTCGSGRALETVGEHVFLPHGELEEYGIEDARITALDGRFYFTYVAVSRHGPATALASTGDFRSFERHGVVFCPENKDVVLFPERIGGTYFALHRPVCGTPFTRPEIWVARSLDLMHWGRHVPLSLSAASWQSGRVGAGAPPIRVDQGWLELYHGNRQPARPGEVGAYYGGVCLLDTADPARLLGQSVEPVLVPEEDFEIRGFVPSVVFPTGVVEDGGSILVYYGAADCATAVAEFSQRELLDALAPSSPHPAGRPN
jgi:predicted GH43/DUF377 family glycosyl hydrolase